MSTLNLLKARWASLALRERRALLAAAVLLLGVLVWQVLLGPALQTLRSARTTMQRLDAEVERMQSLQARAQALQAQPALTASAVEHLLQRDLAALGKAATLQLQGDQATLTLTQVPAIALAQWLADARAEKLHPAELHLQRDGSAAEVRWSGTMVFLLPSSGAR